MLPCLAVLGALLATGGLDSLAERYGVHSRVRLASAPGQERGLFVTEPVRAGEPVLAVPFLLCLVCRAEAEEHRITSPWHAPHHDARDTLLARQLLMALEGDDTMPQELREFWSHWSMLLPPIGTLAHAVCLPSHLLSELQDSELARAVTLQQARVEALLADEPRSDDAAAEPAIAVAMRRWAVALCSSRPFAIPTPAADPVSGSIASMCAFVPFIDMANHAEEPNCEVQGAGSSAAAPREGAVEGEGEGGAGDGAAGGGIAGAEVVDGADEAAGCGAAGEASASFSAVGLIATRDLAAGEEVLISYFKSAPNAHIFSRFGFVPADGNRHDRLGLPEGQFAPLSGSAVRETTSRHSGRWDDAGPLLEAALLSLPLTREESAGPAAEVCPRRVHKWKLAAPASPRRIRAPVFGARLSCRLHVRAALRAGGSGGRA